MTLTLADIATGTVYIDPADLVPGDVINFWGEFHAVERIVPVSGPLVDAGLTPGGLIALADGGTWQMTLPTTPIPVIRPGGAQ
jgi:hypothetical protein